MGKSLFNIDMRKQININFVRKANITLLFAGFSYDDTGEKTKLMLNESLSFLKNHNNNPKIMLHLEGAQILSHKPAYFFEFMKKGLKSIGLVHSHDNELAGSSSSSKNLGLSKKGKDIVKLAFQNHLMIDLAHMSKKSFSDIISLVNKPPFLSHTACYEIEHNPRNTTDIQIKEIAKLGGVIGIFFSGKYVNSSKKPTIQDVAKHFEHVAGLIGTDYLAIGSDFGGITTGTPVGLESINKIPNLFIELEKRGFTTSDIKKIAYENAKRVINNWWPNFLS